MLHLPNIKFNHQLGMLAFFGLLTSIGIGMVRSAPTYAVCADDNTPCVEVSFGAPEGNLSVSPGLSYYDSTKFYLPVEIGLKSASLYTVKVYGSGSSLVSGTESIPSIGADTSYEQLGQNGSEWGIRWNFGDTIEDKETSYHRIPASSDDDGAIVVENQYLKKSSTIVRKQLTLGFAVAVGANQPSGDYTNTITVAVVASPRDARSFFDISTMQEMTPEICANTTTPDAGAISTGVNINETSSGASYTTAIDTAGFHPDDPSYVPQKELIDTRDGKKYTIRKLADGNCWMVSNLEFDLVPSSAKDKDNGSTPSSAFSSTGTDKLTGSDLILTSEDTDLNSMDTWTPAIAAATYGTAGTVYKTQKSEGVVIWTGDGSDGLRSFSSTAAYPTASYSIKTATSPLTFGTASTGSPWQRLGNLYNWTTATLGSSKQVTTDGQDAANSICPKGWRLPPNTGDSSYATLFDTYGLPAAITVDASKVNQFANFPLNFLRTGSYAPSTSSKISDRNTRGSWWLANGSTGGAKYLFLDTSGTISPQNGAGRGYGFAVRCVARQ